MGYSADKSPLIGHLAGPIRRLKPLGAQRQEKCGPNHLTREGLHATTPRDGRTRLIAPSPAPYNSRSIELLAAREPVLSRSDHPSALRINRSNSRDILHVSRKTNPPSMGVLEWKILFLVSMKCGFGEL